MDAKAKRVILASASPRRQELILKLFDKIECMPQDVDETTTQTSPDKIVEELSLKKLNELDKKYKEALIISADTIVYFNGKIYGKPKDKLDAIKILSELNNQVHYVFTGVCISYKGQKEVFSVKSEVKFKNLKIEEIEKYVEEKNPLDKAGAYGIQDDELVLCYQGSYTNIVGLPIEELAQKLKKIGVLK